MKSVDYQTVIHQICDRVKPLLGEGELPRYIPDLAQQGTGRHFGMAIKLVSGEEYSGGEAGRPFSIQSISKLVALTLALQKMREKVWKRLDKEPSGAAFNSVAQLENARGFPKNPFLNSGALVVADILLECMDGPDRAFLEFLREVSANAKIKYDEKLARCELACGYRNRALVNYLKEFNSVSHDVDDILGLYVHFCSVGMSCLDMARAFSYLANEGRCLTTNKRILTASQTKRLNALLMTCGTYNAVGDFAYRVGLPGKSGVGGGIVAVMPRQFVVCVWSPRLNAAGNSLAGTKALEWFTTRTRTSIF